MQGELKNKIIGVGFQKTGTSSLRDALKILGYTVGDNNYKLLWPILHNNLNAAIKKIRQYDAVEDNPWPLLYKELDQNIPGCKFILTLRDEEGWYQSVSKHIGDLRDPMHEWIYGKNKGLPKDDKENTMAVYRRHNQDILEYFKDRPDDLLLIDFSKGEGWEKLCLFLNKPVPEILFPHANNRKTADKKIPGIREKIKKQKKKIKYALQIKYYRMTGGLK